MYLSCMDRHPKEFIDNWVQDLAFAFLQAEVKYERPLDRGTPREVAIRNALSAFLPRRYGVTHGHVVSAAPAWSRQSDVIIFNALEAPVFCQDDGFQGTVLPAESVFGVLEVKSSLSDKEFSDAADKIADFKKVSNDVKHPRLGERFGGVFAFRLDPKEAKPAADQLQRLVEIARAYPDDQRVDEIFVLGMSTTALDFEGHLASLIPQGGPKGAVNYYRAPPSRKNLKIFLLSLYSRLRRIRTGPPVDILPYLFERGVETKGETGPDPRRLRLHGEAPVRDAVNIALKDLKGACPMCKGTSFGVYEDLYRLVATKDDYFGKLGGPQIPVAVLECEKCFHLSLHSTNGLGVTTSE